MRTTTTRRLHNVVLVDFVVVSWRRRLDDIALSSTSSPQWGCCFDVVISTLSSRHRYNVVDSLRLSPRRRWQMTRTMSIVGRPTLSSFAVCRRSQNPLSCMRPCDYDVHVPACVSRPTLCPGVWLWLFIYDVCPGNFVIFVPALVSRSPVPSSLSQSPWVWKWK